MKKNKNSKLLLLIVIIIWGFLIYKIYDAFRPKEQNIRKSTANSYIPPRAQEKDTFSLLSINTDPFLGIVYKKEVNTKKEASATKKHEEIIWPIINYLGIVSDNKAGNSVFILQINGQQQLLMKGETIQELTLVKGSHEKVVLRYKGKEKEYLIM